VVTSTLAFEGDLRSPGLWRETPGGYEDWRAQRDRARGLAAPSIAPRAAVPSVAAAPAPAATAKARTKLSYKEQRELESLPDRIAALETEQKSIGERLASSTLYTEEPQRVGELQDRYAQIDDELLQALERWEALDARARA
jgi:ATP-binding cassette subfamily F protein uup